MLGKIVLVFAFTWALASGAVVQLPQKTDPVYTIPSYTGKTPRPTSPSPGDLVVRKLERRGLTTECAYALDGVNTGTFSCQSPYNCYYNYVLSYMGCCLFDANEKPYSDCILKTACFDSAYAAANCPYGVCGSSTRVCNEGTNTICDSFFAAYLTTTYEGWFCGAYSTAVAGFFSIAANSPTTTPITTTSFSPTTTATPFTTPITTTTTTTPPSTTTTTSQSSTTPPPTPPPSPFNNSQNNTNPSPSTSHTGAIAGGVVGGLAGLAIVIAAAWFISSRVAKKRRERAADPLPQMTGNVASMR